MLRCLSTALALAAVVSLAGAQTVTVTLDSPQAGTAVAPGTTIEWSVVATVSTGDNQGLALLICDLVQDAGNPAFIDIPQADPGSIDATMQNFDRPAGITNPGENGAASGYVGVQRGTAGQMNLIQLGGAQNTFGQAMPSGTGLAENANVIGGVGQSGPQVIVSGSFTAPAACGSYTFSLANVLANVLTQVNSPPAFSPVVAATVDTSGASFTVSVSLLGDINGDGTVDLADLSIMLSNYGTTGGMTYQDGDLDGDGAVDLSDLSLLLSNYGQSC